MDTRVKERLVGAVILVGIIVALVPEMLSGPKREAPVPAAESPLRTYTIDLAPTAGSATPPREEVSPGSEPGASTTQGQLPAPPDAGTSPSQGEAPQAQSTAPRSSPRPPTQATPAPRASTPEATAPSQARRAGATRQEGATPDSGWAVQLGSFASRENAGRLAEELKKSGYRAFVSRFDSGRSVRYRVRVGPEEDRAKAETLAQRLRRDGRQASVVIHPEP